MARIRIIYDQLRFIANGESYIDGLLIPVFTGETRGEIAGLRRPALRTEAQKGKTMARSKMQQVIKEIILPHFTMFKQKGRLIFIDDTQELLRGIYFDSSSFIKDAYTVEAFIQPLYLKGEYLIFNFGDRIRDDIGHEWHSLEDKECSSLILVLVERGLEFVNQGPKCQGFL